MNTIYKITASLDLIAVPSFKTTIVPLPISKETEKTFFIAEGYEDKRVLKSQLGEITQGSNELESISYRAFVATKEDAENLTTILHDSIREQIEVNKSTVDKMIQGFEEGVLK